MKKIKFTSKLVEYKHKIIDSDVDTEIYKFKLSADTDFKVYIIIDVRFDTAKFENNEVIIKLTDKMYETVISKVLVNTKLDRLDSILYELIGRYFGIFEGSKPDDYMLMEFDDLEHFSIIADNLGFDD